MLYMIEMEENAPLMFLRSILRPLFVKIGQNFFDRELTIESFRWR
jgi:hypothetical protein